MHPIHMSKLFCALIQVAFISFQRFVANNVGSLFSTRCEKDFSEIFFTMIRRHVRKLQGV